MWNFAKLIRNKFLLNKELYNTLYYIILHLNLFEIVIYI